MQMWEEELSGGVLKVVLVGSLDIPGAAKVDLPLNVVAGSRDRLAIDISGVKFLSSMGVRTLVMVARAIGNRGGKVVLIGPSEGIREVLSLTGVDTIMPIFSDDAEARTAFA
jgi:anti-sigma B factor antagonist